MAGETTVWNPWRALRERPHLQLAWGRLSHGKGRIVDHGDGQRTVTLDTRLTRIDRNAVLAHELVHDELDFLWARGTPAAIVAHGERVVDRIVADRLVPPQLLHQFVYAYSELEGVTITVAADEFQVPLDVADLALQRLPFWRAEAVG